MVNEDDLDQDFEEIINTFDEEYSKLEKSFGISKPNKIHIITDHLPEYLRSTNSTLKDCSDQVIETLHTKLDEFLKTHGFFRKNSDSSTCGQKLLEGILGWNSYALGYNK